MTNLNDTITQMLEMYEGGCSDVQVCARLKMTHAAFKKLQLDNAVFRDAVGMGHILQKAWWEDQGHQNLKNKTFNANLYGLIMKNRYGYGERTTIVNGGMEEIESKSTDQLQNELLAVMPALAKTLRERVLDDNDILRIAQGE
jgi:hypothetical protein